MLKEHKRSVYSEAESRLCILDHFNQGGWIMALIEATNWFFWLTAACLSIRDPSQEEVLNTLPSSSENTSKHFTHYTDYSPFFSWVSALRERTGRPVFSKRSAWMAEPEPASRAACPGVSPGTPVSTCVLLPSFWFLTPATGLDRDVVSHTNIH